MRVHQVLAALSYGDAIGNEALAIQRQLRAAGHEPPVNAITVACGVGALTSAAVGVVSTCLTGPTNAILTASGEKPRHYSAGIVTGVMASRTRTV